ncbi:uncharacterized protein [Panulirus ornatus]|uniref:uncharacterized protein n=1 Tax=Panulirus ornatus TaxID=150431 RepID=UPI003A89254F
MTQTLKTGLPTPEREAPRSPCWRGSRAAEAEEEEAPRLYVTASTNPNQSVVVANSGMVLLGLLLLCCLAFLIPAAFQGRGRDTPGYVAPSSYSKGPTQEGSSYAVQRSLEEGAKKFQ